MASSPTRELLHYPHRLGDWHDTPAEQQPQWRANPELPRVRSKLTSADPLVTPGELAALRRSLAAVARGDALLLQAGDCAESLDECTDRHVFAKVEALNVLADHAESRTRLPVTRVGRMGGQFAKPRSRPVDQHQGMELPAFRGHLINSELPTREARHPDPLRMLWAYEASARVHRRLTRIRERAGRECLGPLGGGPWSSHEALVLDYEGCLMRVDPETDRGFLASAHLPWIGERTRAPDGAHVRMLVRADNPVGCKIGPTAAPEDVVRLCAVLDPDRTPGRLTLIARMGRGLVEEVLPPIAAAVRRNGHPVVWLCDPMHGNTRRTDGGVKTRHLADIVAEANGFRRVLERQRLHPGGLHLEVAEGDVTECVGGLVGPDQVPGERYMTLCDPRLNLDQAFQLLEAYL